MPSNQKCRSEWGLKNVYVMLPMVRTLWEAREVLQIMKEEGLERSKDFKIWFMAETPSIAIMADEFSKLVDGFSIGSNDMTQGVLMIDRDSERLGQMGYFDERDPAVKRIIAHLIKSRPRKRRNSQHLRRRTKQPTRLRRIPRQSRHRQHSGKQRRSSHHTQKRRPTSNRKSYLSASQSKQQSQQADHSKNQPPTGLGTILNTPILNFFF